MNILLYFIPIAAIFGGGGLAVFIWALRTGQFEDPAGSAARAIQDHERPAAGRGGSDAAFVRPGQ